MSNKHRGFTLIEFLIALVIIGFIVALLVNFFSDPLDQAQKDAQVTRAIDNFRTLENGVKVLKMRTGCTVGNDACGARVLAGELVSSGILSGYPAFDAAIFSDGVGTGGSIANGAAYGGVIADANFWGATRGVMWVELSNVNGKGVTETFCKAFNERLGYGSAVITQVPPQYVDPTRGAQCFKDVDGGYTGTVDQLVTIWPVLNYTP